MTKDSHCPVTATQRYQVTTTQAEIVGNRHDTTTRIELPAQTLWITVP